MPQLFDFLWIMMFLCVVMGTGAGLKGGPITCECTTVQCVQQQMLSCTTESLCFTQHLELEAGRPSLVRGCIVGRTPLLCENRKPSKAKNWPLLHCCGTDFCNRGTVPTPPPWHVDLRKSTGFSNQPEDLREQSNATGKDLLNDEPEFSSETEQSLTSFMSSVQKSPWPHIVSPIYVSVLVLGIVSLIIIGIVAASVIRRNNRFYSEQYGALEFQRGKRTRVHCDYDSEIESVGSSSQPYLHIVCPDKNNT